MSATIHPVMPGELMAFIDGETSAEKSVSIAAHLAVCSDCKDLTAQLRSTSQFLSQWQVDEPKASLQERITSVANEQPQAATIHTWLWHFQVFFSRRLTWAMMFIAMVLLIGIRLNTFRFARSTPVDKAESYHSVLLTNPPAGTPAFGDNVSAGGGGDDKYAFSIPQPAARPQTREVDATKLITSPAGPMIARMVSLSIVMKEFDAGRASLDAILARHNGYAASLNVSTPQEAARTLQASLRIPAPQLGAAVSELKSLGRVENEAQNGEEVTQQHADLVARLKNSRETEQRLQDVLRTRTGKVKDVLEVEEEIARVRGEIEQMEAEQKTLEHRVEFATIDLKLSEEYKAQLNPPAPSVWMLLRNATVNGFRNAFDTVLGTVLFFAESGPTLAVWLTILGIPAWLVWRRYRRIHALSLGA